MAQVAKAAHFGPPETMYCAEQIRIPTELPEILKNYTKHVIKSQPNDIISASAEYFGRLAKQRVKALNGSRKISNQLLESIYKKLSSSDQANFSKKDLEQICSDVPYSQIVDITTLGGWSDSVPWLKFWSLLVASAAGTIHSTIEVVTEILGDNGTIHAAQLTAIIQFLTERDPEIPNSQTQKFLRQLVEMTNGKDRIEIVSLLQCMRVEIPVKFDSFPQQQHVSPKIVAEKHVDGDSFNNEQHVDSHEVKKEIEAEFKDVAEDVDDSIVNDDLNVGAAVDNIVDDSVHTQNVEKFQHPEELNTTEKTQTPVSRPSLMEKKEELLASAVFEEFAPQVVTEVVPDVVAEEKHIEEEHHE